MGLPHPTRDPWFSHALERDIFGKQHYLLTQVSNRILAWTSLGIGSLHLAEAMETRIKTRVKFVLRVASRAVAVAGRLLFAVFLKTAAAALNSVKAFQKVPIPQSALGPTSRKLKNMLAVLGPTLSTMGKTMFWQDLAGAERDIANGAKAEGGETPATFGNTESTRNLKASFLHK